MHGITAEQVIGFVQGQDNARPPLSIWGRYASSGELRKITARLFLERNPAKLAQYLKIFSQTPLPEFDGRLIILSNHPDSEVRHRALQALAMIRSPKVRTMALQRLEAGRLDGDTVALLRHNYEPADHRRIEALLPLGADPDDMHWLCWELEHLFRNNETSRCAGSMRFAYEQTPCSNCRDRIVNLLNKVGKLPAKLLEECRYDANPEIREEVANP